MVVLVSSARAMVTANVLLNWLCFPPVNGRLGEAFGFLDDVIWCDAKALICSWSPPSPVL
jgi:hypothetical protein